MARLGEGDWFLFVWVSLFCFVCMKDQESHFLPLSKSLPMGDIFKRSFRFLNYLISHYVKGNSNSTHFIKFLCAVYAQST